MSIKPSACGPTSMPAIRNTATSGIPSLCATRPVKVPTARMTPQASRTCFATSTADASNVALLRRVVSGRGLFCWPRADAPGCCPTGREMARLAMSCKSALVASYSQPIARVEH